MYYNLGFNEDFADAITGLSCKHNNTANIVHEY